MINEKTISRDKKARLYDVNLDLNDDKMNTTQRKLTFILKDLQRLDLIF